MKQRKIQEEFEDIVLGLMICRLIMRIICRLIKYKSTCSFLWLKTFEEKIQFSVSDWVNCSISIISLQYSYCSSLSPPLTASSSISAPSLRDCMSVVAVTGHCATHKEPESTPVLDPFIKSSGAWTRLSLQSRAPLEIIPLGVIAETLIKSCLRQDEEWRAERMGGWAGGCLDSVNGDMVWERFPLLLFPFLDFVISNHPFVSRFCYNKFWVHANFMENNEQKNESFMRRNL